MTEFISVLTNGARQLEIPLSQSQSEQMQDHWRMVWNYNQKVNLTAIKEDAQAAEKHYLDSLLLLPYLQAGMHCLDLGSGAGFPGIPLAIAFPQASWVLLESLQKRCLFLLEAKEALGLNNLELFCGRAEKAGRDTQYRGRFDLVTARAVASLPILLEYALPFLKVGGVFVAMKGPSLLEELEQSGKASALLGGSLVKTEEKTLPVSGETRTFALIQKTAQTPDKYPRREGIPEKTPL